MSELQQGSSSSGITGPRQVTKVELLDIREASWRQKLRNASLVAEADIRPAHTEQAVSALGFFYVHRGEAVLRKWPACLAASMAGVAATHYEGGVYWPALWEKAAFRGTAADQRAWGRAFLSAIERIGLAAFPELPLPYVGPILMHAGIPTYCLGDYFRLLLDRRRREPGMDAESFLAWATAPGRDLRLTELDVPARRFLTDGGDYALDVVDRCLDLLDRLEEPDPDLDGVRLPVRIIEAGRKAAGEQGLRQAAGRRSARSVATRRPRPRIGLDPYGAGVQVVLPAVGDAPDGIAIWRVTADGNPVTVRSRAHWVGVTEAAPETVHPLSRPVRTVQVSLVGWDQIAELQVVEPTDPILFFGDDGRRLPSNLPLPPDQTWVLYPADRELQVTGDLQVIADIPVPFGWEGWQLRLVSLERVRSVGVSGGRPHVIQGFARPRLLLGSPTAGFATPYGSPVYEQPPLLWLPGNADSVISWHVEVRPAAGGPPIMSGTFESAGEKDIWRGVARPVLGAFDITVRGPLGRGMRRTVFIAEGVSATFQPAVRALTAAGLQPATASLRAPVGASANPANMRFGLSDLARVAEIRAGEETEPIVVTPPHVEILCTGGGARSWTAAPLHLIAETITEVGHLLIRAPRSAITADLQVLVGSQHVQTVPAGGQRTAGMTGYDLARAGETVAHFGRAELVLPWGNGAMPIATVRPRRLASGAHIEDGVLVIHDCAHVTGLSVGIYAAWAPWREPVVVPVPDGGVIELPSGLANSGPMLVLLQVEDPWTSTDWPTWPSGGAYLCDAPGYPIGADYEESAVSAYLAGSGQLPQSPGRLDRLWRVVQLADQLVRAGGPADLQDQCAAVLGDRPASAILSLADAGLNSAASIAGLVSTGLAARRPNLVDAAQAAERLWGIIPSAAAVLASKRLGTCVDGGVEQRAMLDAASAQCGAVFISLLEGQDDPNAQVGRFGPDAERMALLAAEQVEAIWQAAAVVPEALLDADTRAIAARRMFDMRRTPELARAARDATTIVRSMDRLLTNSPYRPLSRQITARRHPDGKGGWRALPAMSAALAIAARLAARGDEVCRAFEWTWRDLWAGVARRAPDIVEIDLVLAEVMIAATERASEVRESA